MKTKEFGTEWQKNNDSLQKKREAALAYLGDKWILKGGKYNKNFTILKQNVSKNS